jgi:hypothetical protein
LLACLGRHSQSVKTIVEKEQAPPTPVEQATVDRFLKRREGRLPAPHLTAKSKPNQPVAIGQSTAAQTKAPGFQE